MCNVSERLYDSSCLCQQLLEDPARKSEREGGGGGGVGGGKTGREVEEKAVIFESYLTHQICSNDLFSHKINHFAR